MASVTLSASVTDAPNGWPVMLIYANGQVVGVVEARPDGSAGYTVERVDG